MKLRKLSAVLIAALLSLLSASLVSAQTTAYATSFTTSITYQNVGGATANSSLTYFAENSNTPIATTLAPLAAGAGASVFVGNVSQIVAGFKGSAVLSSDQPLVATLVQIPAATSSVKNRPLSNGFSAGAGSVRLASVLKNQFNTTTVFSVQNAGSAAVNFNVSLIPVPGSGATINIPVANLPAGAAKYFDMGTLAGLPASFNGSATITASTAGASLVATAMELSTNARAVSAFEGVTGGASTVYMPSAICNFIVSGQPTNTFYAIQNVGAAATTALVTFSSGKTFTTASIASGGKASVPGCSGGNANGFLGSATITTGGSIVAIGKVSGAGISSAFLGATAGSAKLALPYVRWTQTHFADGTKQRAFIAIQNVGGPLAANSIKVKYVDVNGATVGTHTIPTAVATGGKVNSNPFVLGAPAAEFGYSVAGKFGGGAIVEGPAGSQLVAVVRVVSFVSATNETVGEDYNGIAIN